MLDQHTHPMHNNQMPFPTKILPDGYHLTREIDLIKDKKTTIFLNLGALVFLIPVIWALISLVNLSHPGLIPLEGSIILNRQSLLTFIVVITTLVVVLLLHEMVHGLFFWIFTKTRPLFALRFSYAYAAAPGWYIPTRQYLVIGLSPLILIDLVAILLLWICPPAWVLPLCMAIAMNTCGALGDLYIIATLLRCSSSTLVLDTGDAVRYFEP